MSAPQAPQVPYVTPPANPRARTAMLLAVQMAAERGGDPQRYLREAWEQTVRGNGAYAF